MSGTGAGSSLPKMELRLKFLYAREITAALQDQNEANLTKNLISLRNQWTVKYEERLAVTDERLMLLKSWLESVPAASDLFNIWEKSNTRQQALQSAIVSLLSTIITLLSSHYSFQVLAAPIVNALLSSQWLPRLNGYLSSTHRDLVLFTLKLFNSLSNYGGGQERKLILEAFAWESKALTKILNMRRRGGETKNILAVPDIRSLFIMFLLSFVDVSTSSSVKTAFLEQRRDAFMNLFRGLTDDPYPLVRRVLEVSWSGIWCDQKFKRTLKVAVFQESTISQIMKLYERRTAEGPASEDIPADLVHHFLLAICTSPGAGVCFRDRGWYPRENGDIGVEESNKKGSGTVYNRILGNVLNGLKINEDSRQQELALRILAACPELVAGYWTASSLTLEPRLSSKWIANVAFLGLVVSRPVPIATLKLSDAQELYNPSPPGVTAFVENILPTVNIKTYFSRGLQSPSALVQHCTALALTKCLVKYESVLKVFNTVESTLNEGDTGRWSTRRLEVEREIRRRVPDLQVVLAFAQQKGHDVLQGPVAFVSNDNPPQANLARNALLLECAQRLLWLYHQLLPNLVSEARFDVAKLLQTTYAAESARSSEVTAGVDTLRHLHVLRLLRASDQFTWSAKTSSHSNFGILLKFYIGTRSSAIRSAIQSLLHHTLSVTVMFQHDTDEISLWLECLLSTQHNSGQPTAEDEGNKITSFIDDCAQRYMKTPYRYIEEQRSLLASSVSTEGVVMDNPQSCPSPLLLVVIEQVCAKMGPRKATDRNVLPVLRFLRRLFSWLAGKVPSLTLLHPLVNHLKSGLKLEEHLSSEAATVFSIKDEMQALDLDLARIEGSRDVTEPSPERFVERATIGDLYSSNFLTMFIHTNDAVLRNEEARILLVNAIGHSLPDFRRTLVLLSHRLLACSSHTGGDLLLLASLIVEKAKTILGLEQVLSLKHLVFQLPSVKAIAVRQLEEHNRLGLSSLLMQLINGHDEQDAILVAEHATFWFQTVMENGVHGDQGATALLWMRYLNSGQLWIFVDFISSGNLPSEPFLLGQVLDVLLMAVPEALRQPDVARDSHRLEQLIRLQSALPESGTLEPIISLALGMQLPLIFPSDLNHHLSTTTNLTADLAAHRQQDHRRPNTTYRHIDIAQILSTRSWTTHTREIVVDLLYLEHTVRPKVLGWIQRNVTTCPVEHLSGLLLALADSAPHPEVLVSGDENYLLTACTRLLNALKGQKHPPEVLKTSAACICQIAKDVKLVRSDLLATVLEGCRSLQQGTLNIGILEISSILLNCCGRDADELVQTVLRHAWTWAVDILSQGGVGAGTYRMFKVLATLIHDPSNVRPHLVEPMITVAIQNLLSDAKVLDFICQVLRVAPLKPASINKQLQAIVQHPKLYELCGFSNHNRELRLSIINLLHTLFHMHPNNTCQPSHIIPLVPLYGGTLSTFDRKLLAILRLYETTRKTSAASYLLTRSTSDNTLALNAIQRLNPGVVFRTCANFPQWRKLNSEVEKSWADVDCETLYDPVYVTMLFSQLLSDRAPSSALVWVQVFRTNVVSLLLRSLSSDDGTLREIALAQIAGLYKCLQDTDMVEKPQVLHILSLLKNSYHSSSHPHPDRLPAYTTLHLAHSLRGVFYPSQFTYPMTARYLLQRPELDITDVPMLYTTLYSADDQWKRDRAWIVNFLGDGMVGKAEWKVLRRRHTWDLVASQFQGTADRPFRQGALKLLTNITSKPFTITQLVLKSSLLTWLEAQLEDLKSGEELAWLKILENIVVLADTGKLDTATSGEWYLALGRCITSIMSGTSVTLDTLFRAVQVVLRLSLVNPLNPQLPGLVSVSLKHLEVLEKTLPAVPIVTPSSTPPSCPPHTGQDLFRTSTDDPHVIWRYGQCVETLWRIAMNLPQPSESWFEVTEKLLLWRAYAGMEQSALGEWARKEAVRSLAS